MRTYETPSLARETRCTHYTLARQMAHKYFPDSIIDGTYAVLDGINATADGQVKIPLTVTNSIE